MTAGTVLDAIKSRRATRVFTDAPVSRETLLQILEAGRWAPSAGNRRLHRFVAIQDPTTIRLIRAVAPGMLGLPTALILICIDWRKAATLGCETNLAGLYIDVGTAAENMLLAGHALGLGTGPVTSFSQAAVRVILNLPDHLSPELFVCVGQPVKAHPPRSHPATPTRLDGLVDWERAGLG
jgi:nitroreductase